MDMSGEGRRVGYGSDQYGNVHWPFPPGGARLNCSQNGHSLRTVTPLYAKVMSDE